MKQFTLENMPREPSPRDRRDVLLCLKKNSSWMLVSHITRKIASNSSEIAKKVCKDYVEQGYALEEPASKYFPKSTGSAFHISDKGIEKAQKIQKMVEDPDTRNWFMQRGDIN